MKTRFLIFVYSFIKNLFDWKYFINIIEIIHVSGHLDYISES